jgi:hypothetical protein
MVGVLTYKSMHNVHSLEIGSNKLSIEVADTEAKQTLGLGNRDSLAANSGMLFVLDQLESHQLWMKDMRFNIDMIWINQDKIIVAIAGNVAPNTYPQSFSADYPSPYVLEVNGNYAKAHNINIGDRVKLTGVE